MINIAKNKLLHKQLSEMYGDYAEKFLSEYAKAFHDDNPPPNIQRFGIVDPEHFDTEKRVLFVAKETNGGKDGWNFLKWLRDGTRVGELSGKTAKRHPTTWYNIGRWASFIFNPEQDTNELIEKKGEALKEITKIAFTNVNKVKGGSSSKRSYQDLARSEIAIKVLSEEIRILKPNLIVCCGTHDTVKMAFEVLGVEYPTIAMPHPAAHIKKWYMMEELKKQYI